MPRYLIRLRCRYDYFYHYPVAHALLYGVCRDFWRLILRKPSDVLLHGNDVRLSTAARTDMTSLFKSLKATSALSSAPKDVTKYVHAFWRLRFCS